MENSSKVETRVEGGILEKGAEMDTTETEAKKDTREEDPSQKAGLEAVEEIGEEAVSLL